MQMRKIRQEQMDEKRARRMKEFQDDRAKEMKDIEQCKKELQKEKDDAHIVKIAERKRLEKIKIANLEREKLLEARARKDAEEETRLAAEYIAKVDREQAARDKALEDRMSRYEEIGQQWADSGAGKRQRDPLSDRGRF